MGGAAGWRDRHGRRRHWRIARRRWRRHPGAYPLIEHERHTAGVLSWSRCGRGVPATCFTPGRGLSPRMVRPPLRRSMPGVGRAPRGSVQQEPQHGRAGVLHQHARPRPVGTLAGVAVRKDRVVGPAAGVDQARAAAARATPTDPRRGTDPRGGCGRRSRGRRRGRASPRPPPSRASRAAQLAR